MADTLISLSKELDRIRELISNYTKAINYINGEDTAPFILSSDYSTLKIKGYSDPNKLNAFDVEYSISFDKWNTAIKSGVCKSLTDAVTSLTAYADDIEIKLNLLLERG